MKTITAEEFDKKFDDGEDIDEYLDWGSARRGQEHHDRVDIYLPVSVIDSLDREAEKLGLTRQALVERWIGERLEEERQAGKDRKRDVAE